MNYTLSVAADQPCSTVVGGALVIVARRIGRASALVIGAFLLAAVTGGAYWIQSRKIAGPPSIAFIPQTAGAMLWDVEHVGAQASAERFKCRLYWNAPTSENDVAGQVSLIDRVARGKYQ